MTERYGKERMKRGLLHFVLGKGVSSIAGFMAMVLVIRALSIEAFAAYSVLTALVDLLTTVSGLGFAHVLLRYVPELYAQSYKAALRNLVSNSVLLRTSILVTATVIAWFFAEHLTPHVGLAGQTVAFKVFLLVVVLRSTTQFLSQVLESTLHQGLAQFAFSTASVVRLLGMTYLLRSADVQLVEVIWVEVLSDSSSLLLVALGVVKVIVRNSVGKDAPADDRIWVRKNLRQLCEFGLSGYLQHMALLPYGGNTNRLVGGRMLDVFAMANFGFAQSLYEYVKRYLPAQLLVGLIRPLVIARYCEHRDFSVAAKLCGQVLQINVLMLGAALAILTVGGSEALSWISAGKYGFDAALLVGMLLFVLLFETQRQQLDLLVQTVGKYQELIPSNILLSCSIGIAVVMVPVLGAFAFPLANLLGLFVANAWIQHRMKTMGHVFSHDWVASSKVAFVLAISVLAGHGLKLAELPWILATLLSAIIYGALSLLFCGGIVRSFINELTRKTNNSIPQLAPAPMITRPKIAFGVLSSKQSARAIDEIATAVFPHPVYVHHDFSKQPEFAPTASNIHILPDPVATAWGNWSLVAASFRLMEASLEDPMVTHFQLLSEACLPIRPIEDFEKYLIDDQPDVMMDILSIKNNDALYSHGWRYLSATLFHSRILRRATIWTWGKSSLYHVNCSVNLRQSVESANGKAEITQTAGKFILQAYKRLFQEKLTQFGLKELAIGGQWFGASRRAVTWLISARKTLDGFTKYYERCHIPDESYIQTLVLNAQLSGSPLRVFTSNHAMIWKSCGTGPDVLSESDIPELLASRKFFARKFQLDAESAARRQVLMNDH